MFLIFKIEYVLVYPEEGKIMKFTDVTVEGEDTKKRFAQNYNTLHRTGATIIIVILFLQISYCVTVSVSNINIVFQLYV